jgi:hypothetical protein
MTRAGRAFGYLILTLLTALAAPVIRSCWNDYYEYTFYPETAWSSNCLDGISGAFAALLAIPFCVATVINAYNWKRLANRITCIFVALMAATLIASAVAVGSLNIDKLHCM